MTKETELNLVELDQVTGGNGKDDAWGIVLATAIVAPVIVPVYVVTDGVLRLYHAIKDDHKGQ